MQVRSENAVEYQVNADQSGDDAIIAQALAILQRRAVTRAQYFSNPTQVKQFLSLAEAAQADQARERFGAIFLDNQHGLIEFKVMFEGTHNQTSVYPREIIRAALVLNAAAVILTHNHPSGVVTASNADIALTTTIKKTLDLVDVQVLDHIITVPGGQTLSFAESGIL